MKKTFLATSLSLVFLVLFNAVFFIIGGAEHTASVWIAYAFIHFAYIMFIATPAFAGKSRNRAMFGFTISAISSLYFVVEFIVGLLFIIIGGNGYKASLIIQLLIAGIYAAFLISTLLANEHTAESVARQKAEVAYIKDAASRIKMLIGRYGDKNLDKQLEKAYDLLHSSPSRTISTVTAIEREILNKIASLEAAISINAFDKATYCTAEIIALTEERNRVLQTAN